MNELDTAEKELLDLLRLKKNAALQVRAAYLYTCIIRPLDCGKYYRIALPRQPPAAQCLRLSDLIRYYRNPQVGGRVRGGPFSTT